MFSRFLRTSLTTDILDAAAWFGLWDVPRHLTERHIGMMRFEYSYTGLWAFGWGALPDRSFDNHGIKLFGSDVVA